MVQWRMGSSTIRAIFHWTMIMEGRVIDAKHPQMGEDFCSPTLPERKKVRIWKKAGPQ